MDPEKYFDMLIDWKKLPAYRLETRIDSILGYYLSDILKAHLKRTVSLVIPEFPLRKGTLNPLNKLDQNRSEKADFYVRCQDGANLLIEVKSDSASRRVQQDEYLRLAQETGIAALIEGLRQNQYSQPRPAQVRPSKKQTACRWTDRRRLHLQR